MINAEKNEVSCESCEEELNILYRSKWQTNVKKSFSIQILNLTGVKNFIIDYNFTTASLPILILSQTVWI